MNRGELLFGTIDSWLIYKLTNGKEHATDYTNASRTMLFDINQLKWDEELCSYFEIDKNILPEVRASSSMFGFFNFEGVDIPITGVAGDQQSALFGQACFQEGEVKNTYGTGCFMLMNTGKTKIESKSGLLTTLCCDANGQLAYALEGSVFIAGAAVQWLRDGLKIIQNSKDTEPMAKAVLENDEVIVVPAFAGLGAPYWDMYARGAIFGLTRDTDQRHICNSNIRVYCISNKGYSGGHEKRCSF